MTDDSSIAVRPVLDHEDEEAFFDVRQKALGQLDSWRPPPQTWERSLFDAKRNPILERIEFTRYVVERDGEVAGRIAAWVDERFDDVGFFGFYDVCDDDEAGRALAWAAADFCRSCGRRRIIGPFDFWPVCSSGVLVDGFDLPNVIGLHHGAPHYGRILEGAGFQSLSDLFVWNVAGAEIPPPALSIERAVAQNQRLEFRAFDPRSDTDWDFVADVYERSYVGNAWHVPMEAEELRLIAGKLVEPELSILVSVDGEPGAIAIAIRNAAESSVRMGHIIPPEAVQRVVRPSRPPHSWRQLLFGIAPEYRGRAEGSIGTALWVRLRRRAAEAGYRRGEVAWTLPGNDRLNNSLRLLGARHEKTYRLYELER